MDVITEDADFELSVFDLQEDCSIDEIFHQLENIGNYDGNNGCSIDRFEVFSEEELSAIAKSKYSKNTMRRIFAVLRIFGEWRQFRNRGGVVVPEKELAEFDCGELNKWIGAFLVEVRKQDGSHYKAKSIFEMAIIIQMELHLKGRCVKFLKDSDFLPIRNTLDHVMKDLQSKGFGNNPKQADVITESMEEELWRKGILGCDQPEKLLNTVVYLLGKHLALRAAEQTSLCREKFRIEVRESLRCIIYTEWSSKTNPGGLVGKNKKPKETIIFERSGDSNRCPVKIFELYLLKSPCVPGSFYLQPIKNWVKDEEFWFTKRRVGRHTLEKVPKKLMSEIGESGHFTLHSLRATSATRLFESGVEEQCIKEVTGHSSDCVREYKRTSGTMKRKISSILDQSCVVEESCIVKQSSSISQSNVMETPVDLCFEEMKKKEEVKTKAVPKIFISNSVVNLNF